MPDGSATKRSFSASAPESDGAADFGRRIREIRKQRRLTLARVAAATGLSVGFLSQVERNITRPSLASLATIARALDTTLSALLQKSDLPISVSRRDGRVAHQVKDEPGSFERLSTTYPWQHLNALKMYMPSGLDTRTFSYDGEMVIYVLDGSIRYIIEDVIYELESGDAIHFSTSMPHRVATPADRPAEILVLTTQPVVDDHDRLSPLIQSRNDKAS